MRLRDCCRANGRELPAHAPRLSRLAVPRQIDQHKRQAIKMKGEGKVRAIASTKGGGLLEN